MISAAKRGKKDLSKCDRVRIESLTSRTGLLKMVPYSAKRLSVTQMLGRVKVCADSLGHETYLRGYDIRIRNNVSIQYLGCDPLEASMPPCVSLCITAIGKMARGTSLDRSSIEVLALLYDASSKHPMAASRSVTMTPELLGCRPRAMFPRG